MKEKEFLIDRKKIGKNSSMGAILGVFTGLSLGVSLVLWNLFYQTYPLIVGVFIVSEIVTFLFLYSLLKKKEEKNIPKRLRLLIRDGAIEFPRALFYGRKTQKLIDETSDHAHFDISQITELRKVPRSKAQPPTFRLTYKNGEVYKFVNPFSKEVCEEIYDTLHESLAKRDSPFSPQARALMKNRETTLTILVLIFTLSIMGLFIFSFTNPPLLLLSHHLSLLLISLVLSLFIGPLLMKGALKKATQKGIGYQTHPLFLYATVCTSLSLCLYAIDMMSPDRVTLHKFPIIEKKQIKTKRSYRYEAVFHTGSEIKGPYLVRFDERTSVRISSQEFTRLKKGHSKVLLEVTYGTLGLPIIKSSQVILNPKN